MSYLSRSLAIAATAAAILFAAMLTLLQGNGARAVAAEESPTPTETVTPTPTPEYTLTTTVYVTPSATVVVVGQPVSVTTTLVQTGTCTFHVKELTLEQSPRAIFAEIAPPAGSTATWTLRAMATGTVTFTAEYYGEIYCGWWSWHYEYGTAMPVAVEGYPAALPLIGRNRPPQ
jgi:hypothetical protein